MVSDGSLAMPLFTCIWIISEDSTTIDETRRHPEQGLYSTLPFDLSINVFFIWILCHCADLRQCS